MKKLFLVLMLSSIVPFVYSQNISKENIIKLAVLAAPAELREGATVYAPDNNGKYYLLKRGTNQMVCLADEPRQFGFSVACYHQDLEPFMQRGRELKLEGKSFKEIMDTRENEVKEGKLKMNSSPSTLFVYSAKQQDYDSSNAKINNGYLRYVIYIPYATAASTGLPLKPDMPGMPWLMDPGTHRAHIMISPEPAKN